MKPAGSIVTCELGHELYRLLKDQHRYDVVHAADFELLEPTMPMPVEREDMAPVCSVCGAKWQKMEPGLKMHFADGGWWP